MDQIERQVSLELDAIVSDHRIRELGQICYKFGLTKSDLYGLISEKRWNEQKDATDRRIKQREK